MEINNYSSSLWATYTRTSVTGNTTCSDFFDLCSSLQSATENSYLQELNNLHSAEMREAPDFSSMTTEEFRDHLTEVVATMQANGETVSFNPSEFTTEELEELKSEMENNPPPPPPPSSCSSEWMGLNFVDYSSLSTTTLQSLFDYL